VGLVILVYIGLVLLPRARQLLPAYATSGDILVDTPEVYTRERLVNDRFQQEAWLRAQLDRTAELIEHDRFAGVEGRLARGEQTSVELAGRIAMSAANAGAGERAPASALTGPAATDFEPNPIDEFRDAQAYRDVIRAELMRTQLDDRHDIEGNTLYRLDFDATVSPGDNTTDLAVVTVTIREAEDDGSMYQRVYDDFYKELQMEIAGAVTSLADDLMYSSEDLRGIDKMGLAEYLKHQICQQVLQIDKSIHPDDPQKRSEGESQSDTRNVASGKSCFKALEHFEDAVSEYVNAHTELRKRNLDLQYANSLRERLLAGMYAVGQLPAPLRALLELDFETPAAGLSSDYIQRIDDTLTGAARYARSRCLSVDPTGGKQFALGESDRYTATKELIGCPPDLKINEGTLASIWMLQRLQRTVGDLKQNVIMKGHLSITASSPPALTEHLPKVIGPYGDPLVNVLCSKRVFQNSWICEQGNPIYSTACQEEHWQMLPICDGAAFAPLLGRFEPGAMPLERVDLERVAADFILAKLNGELSTFDVALPLKELFPDTHTDCSLGGCTLVLEPERDRDASPATDGNAQPARDGDAQNDSGQTAGDTDQCVIVTVEADTRAQVEGQKVPEPGAKVLGPVYKLCDKLNDNVRAFSYAVMPTEWSQALATEEVTRTSLLAALQTAAANGGANLEAALRGLNDFEERVETRYRNPIVFGFASQQDKEDWTQQNLGQQRPEIHFGWIIRPRLAPAVDGGGRSFRQMPGFFPLGAIVSVPSWWRRLNVEVNTAWVNPNGWWFTRQNVVDLFASLHADCTRPECQSYDLRVPGSIKEIKEKLRYEVRKEPYIAIGATPNQFLEIGRPGQIVLEGGRLWRSTVVRMGHQQADRIVVLPDMRGIIAEFKCVQPPAGEAGLKDALESKPNAGRNDRVESEPNAGLSVPVHVWTS
jgi:hypothetical protein